MKNRSLLLIILSTGSLLFTSCQKNQGDTWDANSTSMSSYRRAGHKTLWSEDTGADHYSDNAIAFATQEEEFIPLNEEDLKEQFSELTVAQPMQSPGEPGSFLPGIEGFKTPTASLAYVFKPIHFSTDDHAIKNHDDLQTINKIAHYLKTNPKTYIFISGHCDQRGPEAYNLALGTKRANNVRALLVQKGVNPEQIHTVSYGKEHLADIANTPTAWAKNRRADFKIYQKK